MVYTLRFFLSSKFRLFHNSNVFGSCIIHILHTGCAKIKKILRQKVKTHLVKYFQGHGQSQNNPSRVEAHPSIQTQYNP